MTFGCRLGLRWWRSTRRCGHSYTLHERCRSPSGVRMAFALTPMVFLSAKLSGSNSAGRVSASQAECRGFESRLPLQTANLNSERPPDWRSAAPLLAQPFLPRPATRRRPWTSLYLSPTRQTKEPSRGSPMNRTGEHKAAAGPWPRSLSHCSRGLSSSSSSSREAEPPPCLRSATRRLAIPCRAAAAWPTPPERRWLDSLACCSGSLAAAVTRGDLKAR